MRNATDFSSTDEDAVFEHVLNLRKTICRLLPNTLQPVVTDYEGFLLLSAAYIYQVALGPTSLDVLKHSSIRQFIFAHKRELELDQNEADILSEICLSVSGSVESLDGLVNHETSLRTLGRVRIGFLAGVFRLANVLNLTVRWSELIPRNPVLAAGQYELTAVHRKITDVVITPDPGWQIEIVVYLSASMPEHPFERLRERVQKEIDAVYSLLKKGKLYYAKVELSHSRAGRSKRQKNPFGLILAPFESRHATQFAGRDRESREVIQRILNEKLVIVIGESGVGKTSLIEAGVIPVLRKKRFSILRFSLQDDPSADLLRVLKNDTTDFQESAAQYLRQRKSKIRRLLFVGDHLEKLFTTNRSNAKRKKFLATVSKCVNSDLPVTFLFSIREDYLPELYSLSEDVPELYRRENTFRLFALTKENARSALIRASAHAAIPIAQQLMGAIAQDLSEECGGLVYPPFLQIVGWRLYEGINDDLHVPPQRVYSRLGKVDEIVTSFFEGLFYGYSAAEKEAVGAVLSAMVTEHRTKRRMSLAELQEEIGAEFDVASALGALVSDRIVRRSLGDYELVHDFLAKRVVELIGSRQFNSLPVRTALNFIEENLHDAQLTCAEIAAAAGVTNSHLTKLFRDQLGRTVRGQLGYARIILSKHLIARSGKSLEEISKMTGFKNPSEFSRKFKEIAGKPPKKHEQEMRLLDAKSQRSEHG